MGTIAEMAFAPSSANVGLLNLDTSSAEAASARDLRSMQLQGEALKNEAERTKQEKMAQAEQYFRQNGISEESIKNYGAQTGDIATTQALLENYNNLLKQKDDQEKAKLEIEKIKKEDLDAQSERISRITRGIDFPAIAPQLGELGEVLPQTEEQRQKMIANQVRLAHLIGYAHQNGIKTPLDTDDKLVSPDQIDWSQQDPAVWQGWAEGLNKAGTTVAQQIVEQGQSQKANSPNVYNQKLAWGADPNNQALVTSLIDTAEKDGKLDATTANEWRSLTAAGQGGFVVDEIRRRGFAGASLLGTIEPSIEKIKATTGPEADAAYMKSKKGKEGSVAGEEEAGGGVNPITYDRQKELRSEFESKPEMKSLSTLYTQAQKANSTWQQYKKGEITPYQVDQSLAYFAAKTLDPGSVVMPGEFERFIKGQNLAENVESFVNKILSGGLKLTDTQRTAMLNIVNNGMSTALETTTPIKNNFERLAKKYKLDPDDITGGYTHIFDTKWETISDKPKAETKSYKSSTGNIYTIPGKK